MINRPAPNRFDGVLFAIVMSIITLGLLNLYSITGGSKVFFQQIFWIVSGGAIAAVVASVDYRKFDQTAWLWYGAGVLALVLVLVLGNNIRGSTRWLSFGGVALQPSEPIKVFLVIALAHYLNHDPRVGGRTLVDLIAPTIILLIPMGLILLQPDLGTALICALIFLTIMVLTQLRRCSLIKLVVAAAIGAPLVWFYGLHAYQKERVVAFYKRLTGDTTHLLDSGWHTHQSLVAIGSGGWFGKGFGKGTQNRFDFLPDRHTDFPFPVWAEEHGFVGAVLVLFLYAALVLWSLRIAYRAKDRFGAVLAVGVGAMIFWQAGVNLAMVSGLAPVVGMTLPLFSYGGSSVLTVMFGLGLLMSVSMRRFSHGD
ncbi:MAG: rod shape-determining protein RodA [Polyangiales bacterium]